MMTNKLHDLIAAQIRVSGPISVSSYMEICLGHPQLGYYPNRDPLGKDGDFTTAPEISQLFGEMVGISIADLWSRLGNPKKLILCELGPGRGTLMKDVLRVLSKIPDLNVEVHLVETSPVLREKQKQLLGEVGWHISFDTLPTDAPIVFIANEFFDALSVRQAVKTKTGWQERVIGLQDDKLAFGLGNPLNGAELPEAQEGEIFEFSPLREAAWLQICERVRDQKGGALVIDYGHLVTKTGNTFQSVKNHNYADVLENPGEQDLTSHVDFVKLGQLATGVIIDYFMTQSEFLKTMGIEIRAERLSQVNPAQSEEVMSGLRRLIHRDEMGNLFKVIGISKCT